MEVATPQSRKKIAIIDDSELVLNLMRSKLGALGYEVCSVSEPREFDRLPAFDPDLILLDINMPEVYGDDVASYLQHHWRLRAPIYLLSDISEYELKRRAKDAQVAGYLCKGWGMDTIVTKIKEIIGTP